MWVSYTDNQNEQTTARQSAGAGEIKEISMDRDTIIDGLRMTMDLCVFDPSTGEEIEPHLLNDINRATYDACKGALEILERLDTDPNTISRQAAITTAVRAAVDWHKLANPQYSIAYCIGEAMRQLPPAQPEIIHCEECVFYEAEDGWCEMHSGYGFWEKAFCSFAKRREVDE